MQGLTYSRSLILCYPTISVSRTQANDSCAFSLPTVFSLRNCFAPYYLQRRRVCGQLLQSGKPLWCGFFHYLLPNCSSSRFLVFFELLNLCPLAFQPWGRDSRWIFYDCLCRLSCLSSHSLHLCYFALSHFRLLCFLSPNPCLKRVEPVVIRLRFHLFHFTDSNQLIF